MVSGANEMKSLKAVLYLCLSAPAFAPLFGQMVAVSGSNLTDSIAYALVQIGPSGPTGPPGCVMGTTCTSALTPASISGVLYADQCPGSNIGAKINACAALLPIASNGYHVGTINLPNTTMEPALANITTTISIGPGVSLHGQGQLASSFTCTMAGDCFVYDASSTSGGTHAHSLIPNTIYDSFSITGSSTQNVMHWKDAQGVTMHDVSLDAGINACLWLEDVNYWTERNSFDHVSTLYNCKRAIYMSAQSGNPFQPHPSFGHNNFSDFKANPNGAQYGLYMTGNAFFYDSTFNLNYNKENAGTIVIHLDGGAEYYYNQTNILGEDQGTGGAFLEMTSASNVFLYTGQIQYGSMASPTSIAAGSQFIHYADTVPFGPLLSTQTAMGPQFQIPIALATGTDLNTLTNCGQYQVQNPVNAPSAIGPNAAYVQNWCFGVGGFHSQTVYIVQGTSGLTRQWQRTEDSGTWGVWREVAWADQMPLVGTTGFLTSGSIPANTCSFLTAIVTGAKSGMVVTATPAYALPATTILDYGLHWNTSYVNAPDTVTVPVCNDTAAPITPTVSPSFTVRVTQ
jgi:hypothetical protein